MENQTNVGDQNIQLIGQDPINQTSIPEKPKVNYWMILTTVFLLVLAGLMTFYLFNFKRDLSFLNTNPKTVSKGFHSVFFPADKFSRSFTIVSVGRTNQVDKNIGIYDVQEQHNYDISKLNLVLGDNNTPLKVSPSGNLFWLDIKGRKANLYDIYTKRLETIDFNDEDYHYARSFHFLEPNKIFYEGKKIIFDFDNSNWVKLDYFDTTATEGSLPIRPSDIDPNFTKIINVSCTERNAFGDLSTLEKGRGFVYVMPLIENIPCLTKHSQGEYLLEGEGLLHYLIFTGVDDLKFGRNPIFRLQEPLPANLVLTTDSPLSRNAETYYQEHPILNRFHFEIKNGICKYHTFETPCGWENEYSTFRILDGKAEKINLQRKEYLSFAGLSKDERYLYFTSEKGLEQIDLSAFSKY